jgi:hypothetical protein
MLDNVINDDAYFMVGEDSFSQISNQIIINIVWQCVYVMHQTMSFFMSGSCVLDTI